VNEIIFGGNNFFLLDTTMNEIVMNYKKMNDGTRRKVKLSSSSLISHDINLLLSSQLLDEWHQSQSHDNQTLPYLFDQGIVDCPIFYHHI
jgi:hypothetical protein